MLCYHLPDADTEDAKGTIAQHHDFTPSHAGEAGICMHPIISSQSHFDRGSVALIQSYSTSRFFATKSSIQIVFPFGRERK